VRKESAGRTLSKLGWFAFGLVQFQGLLGGLRVVMFKDELGVFHGTLAQLFFVLTCAIALFTSKWWKEFTARPALSDSQRELQGPSSNNTGGARLRLSFVIATGLILLQLILGAAMRHQHAGLAIPDFPLAYGKLWPATDPESVMRYNQQRLEVTAANPITSFQIQLQMAHRVVAVLILTCVISAAWQAWKFGSCRRKEADASQTMPRPPPYVGGYQRFIVRFSLAWLGLILTQAALGAATVLTDKAADIATAHVIAGALSLATGAVLGIVSFRNPESEYHESILADAASRIETASSLVTRPAAAP
jgi:heme a synthase